jgi:dTDP-4-dehydrorhamnose 3,5-epimerase-like enzyme
MAKLIDLKTFSDKRGNLTVIEKVIPFDIKRIFYIYGVDSSIRGGHRHHKTIQAAICIRGRCTVSNNDGTREEEFHLDSPSKCLVLETQDWHAMPSISTRTIIFTRNTNDRI